MKRSYWIFTVVLLALLAAGALIARHAAPLGVTANCGGGTREPDRVTLGDMRIRTPLYAFLEHGRFVRRDLSTGLETLLSDHGFDSDPTIVVSSDHRWISYSGKLAHEKRTQYWLYDRATGTDRLVMEHPAWGGSIPVFSPDGRRMAIAANYDTRWPDASMTGAYVFDTATLQQPVRLGISETIPREAAWTAMAWSRDGERLLFMARDMRPNSNTREYRVWRSGEAATSPIQGRWITDALSQDRDAWFLNGEEIPLNEPEGLQGARVSKQSLSPDGHWAFRLEDHGEETSLTVKGPDGQVRQADRGRYQQCEGFGLVVIGWLDSEHLVYRKPEGVPLVYEVTSGRVARLVSDKYPTYEYGW